MRSIEVGYDLRFLYKLRFLENVNTIEPLKYFHHSSPFNIAYDHGCIGQEDFNRLYRHTVCKFWTIAALLPLRKKKTVIISTNISHCFLMGITKLIPLDSLYFNLCYSISFFFYSLDWLDWKTFLVEEMNLIFTWYDMSPECVWIIFTSQKYYSRLFVRLWITWKAKQSFFTGYVREQSTNQIRQGATDDQWDFVRESSKNIGKG